LLVRLLDASGLEVLQDHLGKGLLLAVFAAGVFDQLVVLVHSKHAVWREALDRKRPGHTHDFLVLIRLVVELFGLALGCNRGVDLSLPRDACLPPVRVLEPRAAAAIRLLLVPCAFS